MKWLRLLLAVGCMGAIAFSMCSTPWRACLVQQNREWKSEWIIQLGNGPMWERPVAPDYQAFRDHFEKPQNFPAPNDVWVITTSYEPWNVILGSLIFCWPTTVVCGLLYHVFRGEKRDWVLHISLYIAIWLSASVGVCVVLWVIVGGWGPLAFDCFAVLGFIGGISSGLVTFRKATPNKTLDNPIQPPS
jgi:hypothetical protein